MSTVRIQVRRGLAATWTSVDPTLAGGEIGLESDTGLFKIGNDNDVWTDLPYSNVTPDSLGDSLGDYLPVTARGTANGVASLDSTGKILDAQLPDDITLVGDLTIAGDLTVQGDSVSLNVETLLVEDNQITLNSGVTGSPTLSASIIVNRGTSPDAVLLWNEDVNSWSISDDGLATQKYLATVPGVEQLISSHNDDTTGVHGIVDTAELATKSYADGAVSTHSSDQTNIHGIADTAALATKTYADNAATTAASGAETNAITAAATAASSAIATAVSNHSDDTTSVHGIADTSALALTTDVNSGLALKQDKVTGVSDTEIGYLDGVTSAIQTQLNAKASSSDLSSHESDTTSIHGISDTANLAYINAANQTFTGNMEVDGNLVVDGDFTVNGTNFAASATSITIEDNMLQLAHQNAANTVDLGLVVGYNDGTAKHSGLVRDVSANEWKLFKGVTTEPTTTVDFTQGSLDDLELNNLAAAGIIFTDGTQTKEGVASRTPIIQKTGSYTLSALTERDSLIEVDSASATTITIPTDATLNLPIGTSLDILQTSTGQVTIAGAVGVTVNSTPGLKLRTRWSSATLFKRAADTWVVYGDLTA